MSLSLADIASVLRSDAIGVTDSSVRPEGVVRVDSREVGPGDVFACVRGEHVDGHDFVDQALERGAVLTIATRPVPGPHVVVDDVVDALGQLARAVLDRRPDLTVVALTGSSGKTSTKDLLAQVFEAAGSTVAPPGSFNNEIGLPLTVLRVRHDTRYLVLEMGARGPGHIRALCASAPPRIGAVLNVGSAHLGEFGDRAAVARAKGELVEALPTAGTAVLNADDPYVAAMAALTPADVRTFGRGSDALVRAVDVELDAAGRASFLLVEGVDVAPVSLQVVGEHQVMNALAAATCARAAGVDLRTIALALSDAVARSPWRMEVADSPAGVTVVNDAYNANPESVRAALQSLVVLGRGRRTWAVLGEMHELGAVSADAHARVGSVAVELGVDRVVAVGAGAGGIAVGATTAGAAHVDVVEDVAAATALLRAELAEGDVVLVKASRASGLEALAADLLRLDTVTTGGDR